MRKKLIMGKMKVRILPNPHADNPLTEREMYCLILLAEGKNSNQCCDLMKISYYTVVTYEKTIRFKLRAFNRVHALYVAIRRGYLKVGC